MIILLLNSFTSLKAQDLRYSMYHHNTFATNPAMIAMYPQAQLSIQRRRQTYKEGAAQKSPMYSFIYPVVHNQKVKGAFGLSVIDEDQRGLRKVTGGSWAGALHQPFGKNIYLNVGMQGGFYGRRKDITTFYNYKLFSSWTAGVFLYREDSINYYEQKWFIGGSVSNLTGQEVYLPSNENKRWQVQAGWRIIRTKRHSVTPNIRWLEQARQGENLRVVNIGVLWRKHFSENSGTLFRYGSIGAGTWYSLDNAAVLSLEWHSPTVTFGFSYDLNFTNNEFRHKSATEFLISLKRTVGIVKKSERPKGPLDDEEIIE